MAERRERVVVEFDAKGAALVRREIQGISGASRSAHASTALLQRALAFIGGAAILNTLRRTADTYTDISNRIRSVTDTQEEYNQISQETFEIAQRTRTPLEDNVLLYQRMRNATRDLVDVNGELVFSNKELLQTQELINKAVIVSGAGSIEASNALRQLTQGLASGALRGDEFRAVSEQLPIVLQFVAKELGVTQGQLRKYAEEGKITNEVIVNAFLSARDEIEAGFAEVVPPLSQTLTQIKNNFLRTFGELNETEGFTRNLSAALQQLTTDGDRMNQVLIGGLSILSGVALQRGLRTTVTLINGMTLAIARNPLGLIAVGASTAIASLVLFNDSIKTGSDRLSTLRDFGVAAWRDISEWIGEAEQEAADFIEIVVGNEAFQAITRSAEEFREVLRDTFPDFEFSFRGALLSGADLADNIIGIFRGMRGSVSVIFDNIGDSIEIAFKSAFNAVIQGAESFINTIRTPLGNFLTSIGIDFDFTPVDFSELTIPITKDAKELGVAVERAFLEGLESGNPVRDTLNRWFDEAEESAARRKITIQAVEILDFIEGRGEIDRTPTVGTPSLDEKTIDKMRDQLRQLEDGFNPVIARTRELAEARKFLDSAVQAGIRTFEGDILTASRANEIYRSLANEGIREIIETLNPAIKAQREFADMQAIIASAMESGSLPAIANAIALFSQLEQQTRAAREPYSAYLDDLDRELSLLRLSRSEREIQIETQRRITAARTAGISAAQLPDTQISLDVRTLFDSEFLTGEIDQLRGPQEELNRLVAQGRDEFIAAGGTAQGYTDRIRALEQQVLSTSRSFDDGMTRALQNLNDEFTNSGAQIESVMVNTFRNAEDALVQFFTTGKFEGRAFADAIIADLTRIAVQQLILAPITALFGGGTSIAASFIPNAQGNAYPHGVRMLAQGDILNRPTLAMVAEAGRPEAVLPLERTSGGDLGVKAVLPPAPRMPSFGSGNVTQHMSFHYTITAPPNSTQADMRSLMDQNRLDVKRDFKEVLDSWAINAQRPGEVFNRQLVVY